MSWKRAWQPTPVSLPGGFHGQESLVGYSPRGHKEWYTTEQLSTHTHNWKGISSILFPGAAITKYHKLDGLKQ